MSNRISTLPRVLIPLAAAALLAAAPAQAQQNASDCGKACMERLAERYLEAYERHDPQAPFISEEVRFTENNVEIPFPEGTWDTVTEEVGPALILSDPVSGNAAIFTAIMQSDTPGFLAVRLGIEDGEIKEIEHIISTRRNLSSPPTPIGEVEELVHEPVINEKVPEGERLPRQELIEIADGYFQTLQRNDGEIRNTCFTPGATRRENGRLYIEIEEGFESGRYYINDRVRREHILVDEERGVVMARGFIDHKGVPLEYYLTDGTLVDSVYREPQSWAFLEMFKIKDGCIAAVVATFYQAPYYDKSPW